MTNFLKQFLLLLFLTLAIQSTAQFASDSIRFNHDRDMTYHSRKIDIHMADHLMTTFPDAKNEMRLALRNRYWSRFFLFAAATVLLIPLQEAISDEHVHWESFAISSGLAIISIPLYSSKEKHLKRSIDLYNEKVEK
jgi:hypothetical protein